MAFMTSKMFTGTGVAIVTPFRDDGTIDFKAYANLIKHLIANNVDYLVVLGTTGESATLTKDEKNALIDFTVENVNGEVPVVVGMGGNNTHSVVSDIKNHHFDGISAILSVAPYYNKPSQEGLYMHYKDIATASPVPVILYNVPGRTGVNIQAETTLRLAHDFENIVAVKEASGDFAQVMKIIRDKPQNFSVISGDDLLTLPLLSIGATGVISVIANAFPAEFSGMVNAALDKNLQKARNYHYLLTEMMGLLFEEGNPAGVKAALKAKNICEQNLRSPLLPVSEKLFQKIKAETTSIEKADLK